MVHLGSPEARQLLLLVTIDELGNIHRAAGELNMTHFHWTLRRMSA